MDELKRGKRVEAEQNEETLERMSAACEKLVIGKLQMSYAENGASG